MHVKPLDKPKWSLTAPSDVAVFLRNISIILPRGSRLVIEGNDITQEVCAFLEANQPASCPHVQVGTVWPKPRQFHLAADPDKLGELAALADRFALPEVFDHLKAYWKGHEVLVWYDATAKDPVHVAQEIEEEKLREFCQVVGCDFREIA